MNQETKEVAKNLRDALGRLKVTQDRLNKGAFKKTPTVYEQFADAEFIIGTLSFLLSPKMQLEHEYRKLIVSFMAEGDSHAKAEARAKAEDVYLDWKKLEALYELAHEQIMLLKRFKDELDNEFRRI